MSYFYIAASQAYLRKHNTSTDVVLMLVHRLRRWPIETTLGEYLVFVATCSIGHYLNISNFVRNDTTHRNRVPS